MATINDLDDIAQAFLSEALAALAWTDEGPPGLAYVSPGEEAMDCCGTLNVWTSSLEETAFATNPGVLGPTKRNARGGLPQVLIVVRITRCAPKLPKSGIPVAADQEAAARMIDQDVWALRNGLAQSLKHGALAEMCAGTELLGWTKLTPQGGCIGWQGSYRRPVEGGILGT